MLAEASSYFRSHRPRLRWKKRGEQLRSAPTRDSARPARSVVSSELICDEAALLALAPEWDALWRKVGGQHHESFEAAWLAWTQVARPQQRSLHCLVYREHGQLVMVWPMVAHTRLFCTVLRPLGPGTADYTTVLLADLPHRRALLAEGWQALLQAVRPDLSYLPYVLDGSDLHAVAARQDKVLQLQPDRGAVALLRGETAWAAFTEQLGPLPGRSSAKLTRRLARVGKVERKTLGRESSRTELAAAVDWILTRKRDWAARAAKQGPWLSSPQFRAYMIELLASSRQTERARLFSITVDGRTVASTLCGLGVHSMFGILSGFDADYARCSPGALVLEYTLQWALEHDLDLDLGVGSEAHKSYWSRDNLTLLWSYEFANTRWGRLCAQGKQGARELAGRLRALRSVGPGAQTLTAAQSPEPGD